MPSAAELIETAQDFANKIIEDLPLIVWQEKTKIVSEFDGAILKLNEALRTLAPFVPATPPKIERGEMPPEAQPSTPEYPEWIGQGPTYQDISDFDANVVAGKSPIFNVNPPDIDLGTKPNQLDGFTTPPPGFDPPTFPTPPDELMNPRFGPPAITDFSPLDPPGTGRPNAPGTFAGRIPKELSGLQDTYTSNYQNQRASVVTEINGYVDAQLFKINPRYHEQMGRIESQLITYLNGGTGLKPEIEDAIYSRAREKNDREAERVRDAAYAEAANRGFTLPSGALLVAVARARQEAANNNLKASSDIVVMQAEMEQKNLQFAVTTSIGLRTVIVSATFTYMQHLGTLNGQALEFAKGILTALVEAYNLSVKAFSVQVEAYKAEITSFDAQLKAVMADVELFQARVKNQDSLIGIDRSKIERYKTQLEGLNVLASVFKAQTDAALGQAQMEKLKLEVFQAQVQTYSAQVQGKNAEWQGYTAAIAGEEAKAKIYASEVAAYSAEMEGYKARLDGGVETVKSQALVNKARAEQYDAEVRAFDANVKIEGARLSTELENQRQYWASANGYNQVSESVNRINVTGYGSEVGARLEAYKTKIGAEILKAQMAAPLIQTLGELSRTVIDVNAKTAAAALSGMNALASVSE